jgi:hypothetical protein
MKKTPLLFSNIRKGLAFRDIALSIKSPPVTGYDLDHSQGLHFLISSAFSSGKEPGDQMPF